MIFGFQHFHPLTGLAPNEPTWFGEDIAFRSRTILKGRNLKQIRTAIGLANWLIDHSPLQEIIFAQLKQEAIEIDAFINTASKQIKSNLKSHPKKPISVISTDSGVTALRYCIDQYDLSDYPDIPNLRWSDLFATLALGLIDRAKNDGAFYKGHPRNGSLNYLNEAHADLHVMFWLIQAMDAVSQAEGLTKYEAISENIETLITNRIAIKNKHAGILRHSKTDSASLALLDFYRNGSFKSFQDCTLQFIHCNPKLVAHLTETNRLRTLSNRLSKLLKKSPR